jgi:hypothetical protein
LAGIAANLHTLIAPVGPVKHDGVVCRAGPRYCCAWAAQPIPGWLRRWVCTANHARERAAARGGAS